MDQFIVRVVAASLLLGIAPAQIRALGECSLADR
jgi:hypothetical protein